MGSQGHRSPRRAGCSRGAGRSGCSRGAGRSGLTLQVAVYTPSHDPAYLADCYRSLERQTHEAWQWTVLLNHNARWEPPDDKRVRVHDGNGLEGVGALKRRCCELAGDADILVELDHDDELAPNALDAIVGTFAAKPAVGFVYSDFASIDSTGEACPDRWRADHGWRYQLATVADRPVDQCLALEPSPHNLSLIWYAPNHVRAFRRSAYELAGGYDPDRRILDDQDLMGRLYQRTEFQRVPECLYLQRVHAGNTQRDPATNARIQDGTIGLYERDVQPNALAWARRRGLLTLDLGAAHGKPDGYMGVDRHPGPGVDLVCDVAGGLPLADSTVGVIRAVDFLEHVADKIGLFNELYRLLAHGGMLLSLTPSTDGRGAWQDPTHVAGYNENSFWYFTDRDLARFVPDIRCRFQVSRVRTFFPSPWHEEHQISYVQANLIALKDGPRQGGPVRI